HHSLTTYTDHHTLYISFILESRQPLTCTLFPYTTLFRSWTTSCCAGWSTCASKAIGWPWMTSYCPNRPGRCWSWPVSSRWTCSSPRTRPVWTSTDSTGCSCWRRRWRTWRPSNAAGPPDSICSRGTSMPVPRSRLSCRRRESNQAAQIQLLNHLYRDNPDFRQLESLLVQDPELCVTLLRQVNSAAYHRPHPVSSIRRAITTLGLQRLKRLILTLLLARNGPASLLMLPQLLTRAAMCERLALHFGTAPPDEAF